MRGKVNSSSKKRVTPAKRSVNNAEPKKEKGIEEKVKEVVKSEEKKHSNKIGVFFLVLFAVLLLSSTSHGYIRHKQAESLENEEAEIIDSAKRKMESWWKGEDTEIEYGTVWSREDFLNHLLSQYDSSLSDIVLKVNGKVMDIPEYRFMDIGTVRIDCNLVITVDISSEDKEDVKVDNKIFVEVKDTVLPIIEGVSDKEVTQGEKIDLKEGIMASDPVDGELEVTVEGTVDTSKPGEYDIKVSAVDKNGNETKSSYKVTVKEKKVVKPSTSSSSSKPSTSPTKPSTTPSTSSEPDASTKNGRWLLAKAEAKRVVSQIITPGMSDYDKAYAIFRYLHSNVSLQWNQSTEAYKTNFGNEAYAALIMKIAACSGFCKAVTLLCNEAGLQSQHVNANLWTHQWNRVLVDGEWIVLDAQGGIFGGTVHPLE